VRHQRALPVCDSRWPCPSNGHTSKNVCCTVTLYMLKCYCVDFCISDRQRLARSAWHRRVCGQGSTDVSKTPQGLCCRAKMRRRSLPLAAPLAGLLYTHTAREKEKEREKGSVLAFGADDTMQLGLGTHPHPRTHTHAHTHTHTHTHTQAHKHTHTHTCTHTHTHTQDGSVLAFGADDTMQLGLGRETISQWRSDKEPLTSSVFRTEPTRILVPPALVQAQVQILFFLRTRILVPTALVQALLHTLNSKFFVSRVLVPPTLIHLPWSRRRSAHSQNPIHNGFFFKFRCLFIFGAHHNFGPSCPYPGAGPHIGCYESPPHPIAPHSQNPVHIGFTG
jgi:hypothetical protein